MSKVKKTFITKLDFQSHSFEEIKAEVMEELDFIRRSRGTGSGEFIHDKLTISFELKDK